MDKSIGKSSWYRADWDVVDNSEANLKLPFSTRAGQQELIFGRLQAPTKPRWKTGGKWEVIRKLYSWWINLMVAKQIMKPCSASRFHVLSRFMNPSTIISTSQSTTPTGRTQNETWRVFYCLFEVPPWKTGLLCFVFHETPNNFRKEPSLRVSDHVLRPLWRQTIQHQVSNVAINMSVQLSMLNCGKAHKWFERNAIP